MNSSPIEANLGWTVRFTKPTFNGRDALLRQKEHGVSRQLVAIEFQGLDFLPTTGDPVTLKVRTFRTTDGEETWDFGDGTPAVRVRSDGNVNIHDPNGFAVTEHRYERAGDYIAGVSRTDRRGITATAHLWIRVEPR